jgi:hypothetical protein
MKGGKKAFLAAAAAAAAAATMTTSTTTTDPTTNTTSTSSGSATTTTTPTTTSSFSVPAGYTIKSARDFGVVCDGVVDDTAALQSALNGLQAYQALQLPAGTCVTSNILILQGKSNVMVFGAGKDATIIKALKPDYSAFVGTQNNGLVIGAFQVISPNATSRLNNGNSHGFDIINSSNVTVDGVKAQHVAGAGIYFGNINGGTIQNSEVDGSLADGFHVCCGSQNVTMQSNVANKVGDDAFASIGYANSGQNYNISILDNTSYDGAWAGGVGIEGTIGAKVYRNKIYRSGIAGIRIDSQTNGGYNTAASDQIDLQDNYLEGCVTRTNTGHGSIMLYANYFSVHGVTGARNQIVSPASGAGVRAYGLSATQDIQASFSGTVMSGLSVPFSIGAYAAVTHSGSTLNGVLAD